MFRARGVNLLLYPQTKGQRQSRQTPLLLSLFAEGGASGWVFGGADSMDSSNHHEVRMFWGLYAMPSGRMCAAEVSAVRSWSQQHVEWDRFSVSVMMTAREMIGSDDYKSLVFRMEQPVPVQGGRLLFNVS